MNKKKHLRSPIRILLPPNKLIVPKNVYNRKKEKNGIKIDTEIESNSSNKYNDK